MISPAPALIVNYNNSIALAHDLVVFVVHVHTHLLAITSRL